MELKEAKEILNQNGYIVERLLDGPILNELGYNSIVKNIVDIIERVYPVYNYQDRDKKQTYTKAEYEIELKNGRTFIVEFSKGHGFEYRGRFYPWKLIEENNGGYTTIAYNFDMLVKWTRKVKAIQQNESFEGEVSPKKQELIEAILNHSCYDLDWSYYQLADKDEEWLRDYLNVLNDREMRRACM